MHTAHHMLLFGCPTPGENALATEGKYWYVKEKYYSNVDMLPGIKIPIDII